MIKIFKVRGGWGMNKVEVIKFNDDIVKMYEVFKIKFECDYLFFKLVIYSGLKVLELLIIIVF